MFCKKCGAQLPDNASFCEKCGTAVTAQEAPVQVDAPTAVPQNAAPAAPEKKKKSKKGLIIAVVIILAVLLVSCFAGGGSSSDPIVGKWDQIAYSDENGEIKALYDSNFYIDCRANGTATLQVGAELTYECTWDGDSRLDATLEDGDAYDFACDKLTDFYGSITEIDGKDTLFIQIPGFDYGMVYQK